MSRLIGILTTFPRWSLGVLALVAFAASVVWHRYDAAKDAEREAEIERLRVERALVEEAEGIRDVWRRIDEDSAADGDGAVIERLRDGQFLVGPPARN